MAAGWLRSMVVKVGASSLEMSVSIEKVVAADSVSAAAMVGSLEALQTFKADIYLGVGPDLFFYGYPTRLIRNCLP